MIILVLMFFALLIERVVQLLKPMWGDAMLGKLPVSSLVGMAIGVAICVLLRLSIADAVTAIEIPMTVTVKYILYVMTGAATGAGSSVVHDLWAKLNSYSTK